MTLRLACLLVFAYAAWCVLLYTQQDRMVFPAHGARIPLAQPPADAQTLTLTSAEGDRVEAWYFIGEGRSAENAGPCVVYFHGNGELIDHNIDVARTYTRMGFNVLMPEYRGYGRSEGRPSQRSITADAVAFYDAAVVRPEVDPQRVLFHGSSLGGGVAAALAEHRPPAALILESTFTSVAAMALRVGGPPFLVRHPFRTDRTLARLDFPVLILHGTDDDVIPISHGRTLAERARNATFVELRGRHDGFPQDREEYGRRVGQFLRDHGFIEADRLGGD